MDSYIEYLEEYIDDHQKEFEKQERERKEWWDGLSKRQKRKVEKEIKKLQDSINILC